MRVTSVEGVPKRIWGLRQLDMADVFARNESRIRHGADDDYDVCIIGAGAGGGVLAAKLAEAGLRVVVLEAGPFWVPERDWVSDEKESGKLYWREKRVTGGKDPIELGANNSGRGVGGSTTHYAMVKLRFHAHDFRTRTRDGVGDDWPIGYHDLETYYDEIEDALGIAGPSHFPWGEFHGPYPQRPHPATAHSQVLHDGCERLGLRSVSTPIATLSSPKDGRPPCTYRGFCIHGCKPNAKSSTLVTFVPRAIDAGAVFKHSSMVTKLLTANGRVDAARYVHQGRAYEQRAKTFFVCGYAIETPRLLLASASKDHPDGLANSSGLVGKRFMTHLSHRVYGRMPQLTRPYKGPPPLAITQEFYDRPGEDFDRGYTIEAGASLPVAMAGWMSRGPRLWGEDLRREMLEYNHYAGIAINGESLPKEENMVRLSNETDANGMPVAHVVHQWGENEKRMAEHGWRNLERILEAAGARSTFRVVDTAHLMGTCRMGHDPSASVVDEWCRTWDVPNLFVCDGSVFVTSSGVNPSLTIEAIAARTADYFARVRE